MYELKEKSQQEFLKFIEEPPESPRWKREGIFQAIDLGPVGKQVKIILLDTRYFRTPEELGLSGGDILGNYQWLWLKLILENSKSQFHIIVSGTQVLPTDKPIVEKWTNYPYAYNKLVNLLAEIRPPGVIFLSGDVHHAEILKKDCIGVGYPVWEVTSSGLTHSCGDSLGPLCAFILEKVMNSDLRVSYFEYKNFGTMEFNWEKNPPVVTLQIRNETGNVILENAVEAGIPSVVRQQCPKDEEVAIWRLQPKGILFKRIIGTGFQAVICLALFWFVLRLYFHKRMNRTKRE